MAIGTPVDLGHNQSAAAASLAITTLAGVSAADDVVVFHYSNSSAGNLSGITDTGLNAYQVLRLQSTAPLAEMWFAPNCNAEAISSSINCAFNGGASLRHAVSAVRIPGMRTAGIVSQFSTTSPTGTATSSSAINFPALTQPEMILFVMIATAATPGVITWGSGFTAIGGNTATAFALPAYKIVADAAPVTDTPTWVNSILYRTLGGALPGVTQPPLYAFDDNRKIYLPAKRRLQAALEIADVPLSLADDALTPPGVSDARLMQRVAQRNAQRSRAEYIPNLLLSTLTPPASGSGGYGVTAGPGMSVHQGVQHSNAHGVGGNQTGNSGVEGIPHDAPQ